ncbi:MAG TPA: RNA polymerase sigma factor [Bacteroidota bacterium]
MSPSLSLIQSDQRIIERMHAGDEEALVAVYETNRKPITAFVTHNNGTTDDADDMLQEALVILWERVQSGKFELTAQLSTFLYATVRNLWYRKLARMKKEIPAELEPDQVEDQRASVLEEIIDDETAQLVRAALNKLGEPCRTLLLLFYWEELSTELIAQRMGFANADTVKAKKYQCKKALEKILKT